MKENIYEKLQNIISIMSENKNLTLNNIESKIQQNIGMLTIIDIMPTNQKELCKKLIIDYLKTLYKQKKELLYGYEQKEKLSLAS